MHRKAEKTQNRNPHGLTRRQHVLPARSIERFVGEDGRVSVLQKNGTKIKTFPAQPKDKSFCADRVWDQRAENGWTKKVVEDPFQDLADRIISGETYSFDSKDKSIVDSFFCLWEARAFFRINPPQDQPVKDCSGIESKDQQELEKNHGLFIKHNNTMSGRSIAGMGITKRFDSILINIQDSEWTIVESKDREFIVPDFPRFLYVPISPTICLVANCSRLDFDKQEVESINDLLFKNAISYVFAKDFSKSFTRMP
ncbi:MAG: DUF4238 domain-containing protein [Leptospirales bacterium]